MCISPPVRGFSCILSLVHVTIYCGLWPPGNTTCLFLTWYQSNRLAPRRSRHLAPVSVAGSRLAAVSSSSQPPPRPGLRCRFPTGRYFLFGSRLLRSLVFDPRSTGASTGDRLHPRRAPASKSTTTGTAPSAAPDPDPAPGLPLPPLALVFPRSARLQMSPTWSSLICSSATSSAARSAGNWLLGS
jgi:hypothetical protein